MPGVVATIAVAEGEAVKAEDQIMTLEAMKMETVITAPCDGTVMELLANPGQSIDAKQLLAAVA